MNLCSYSNLLPHSVIKYEWLLRNDEIAMLRIYQKQNYDSAGELIDATSIRQYIELKKQTLKPAIIYCKEMRELLGKAFEARRVKYERKKEACEDICAYLEHTEKSLEVLEKQPYLLWDNIYWEIAYFKIPQKACEAAVIFRLKGPAYEQASKHNDYIFRQAVLGKYNAVRTDLKLAYCHLTGWHPIKDIEAACIVPIDLESEELSYLFAVDDLLLFDSSNGISLHKIIKSGLDRKEVVFVPTWDPEDGPISWRCVLRDTRLARTPVYPGITWGDLHGLALNYVYHSRHADGFLFFQFITACLQSSQEFVTDWVIDIDFETRAPESFLRRSMLVRLATKFGVHFLERFVPQTTPEEPLKLSKHSDKQEKLMARNLSIRLMLEHEVQLLKSYGRKQFKRVPDKLEKGSNEVE